MPIQTTYTTQHGHAYEGMIADKQLRNAISKKAETSDIGYGHGVIRGLKENSAKLPAGAFSADKFVGIVQRELNRVSNASFEHLAPKDQMMSVVTTGVVWVYCESGCSQGDKVFMVHTSSSGNVGRFRTNEDSGKAVEIPGAKFVSKAAAGKLAKVSLNIGG